MTLAASLAAALLATTGGTFDPVPWIVGGLIAIGLGAFALVILNRRRGRAAAAAASEPAGEPSAAGAHADRPESGFGEYDGGR